MIASERSQNIIVVSVIMITIVSSMFLAGNASYYGNSYSLAGNLNVTLLEIEVRNINHINESITPSIGITFNFATSAQSSGNVRITFMGAAVRLNSDTLAYTIFSHIPLVEDQYIYPDFNMNYSMSDDATESDKQTILDADISGIWNWEIELRYSFMVFDEGGTNVFRYLNFNTTTTTIV